jgi:TetR/AcrR family transcriptional regulator
VAQGRRRDAILAAARSEFARHGFAGARIERIAATAGVNKQLIFHYFRSKEGLHSAVLSAVLAGWQPTQESGTSPPEHLRRVTTQLVQWLSGNPGAARAIAEAAPGAWPADSQTSLSGVGAWLLAAHGAVRSAVENGQRQGHFRDDADPGAVADIVTSAAVGHALTVGRRTSTSSERNLRLAEDLSQAMVDFCAWR